MTAVPAVGPDGLRTRSLRTRVTVVVLVFVAAMLLVLGVATDVALRARLEGELRQRLADRAVYASVLVGQVSSTDLVDRLEGDGVSVSLRTSDGQVITQGPLRPDGDPSPAPPAPAPGPKKAPTPPVTQSGQILQVSTTLSDGSLITLLADAGDVRRTLDQVRTTLLVAGIGLLVLAALTLGPVIGRALRPLDQMTATARSITAGDRGQRLRPDRPDTELGRTATAFDAMLDEVEGAETSARAAEHRLRTFLSDAAHELRTPLTGVQAGAERLLRGDGDRARTEELSVTVIREARRAGRLVDDMLTMARIDSGLQLDRAPHDLRPLAERVAATAELRHPGSSVAVSGAESLPAPVDPDRLVQVLTNLVENALTAGGPGATVRLELAAAGERAVVDVTDDGPGIPAADRERVFERLVRLDPARSNPSGSGLGLPIARGIAEAHGGSLVLLPDSPDRDRGAWFRLELPHS
ncbi:ATP-binding protein [uncultured Friedmanniella sp.]|uniref:HAMP domain-containing sensor histidine kinase n=1 Tax=uncultured Friedmanniella sp. TaxID=335381 RepID=UPI0035CA895B